MNAIPDKSKSARRPLKSRDTQWARTVAMFLARHHVAPNLISFGSVVSATVGAILLLVVPETSNPVRAALLILAALFVQLRLLCNLFDGMVAVEGKMGSKSGEVWNDLPDRVADPLFLIGAGYATGLAVGPELGWAAGLLAVFTAYVRLLGASAGLPQHFIGIMAKPQRMAVLTGACFLAAATTPWHFDGYVLAAGLVVLIAGSALTAITRTLKIVSDLENRP